MLQWVIDLLVIIIKLKHDEISRVGILIANLLCLLEDRETPAKANVAWILPARSKNLIAARYIIPRHILPIRSFL